MTDAKRSEANNVKLMVLLTMLFIAISFLARYCGNSRVPSNEIKRDTVTIYRYDTVWKEVRLFSPTVIQYVPAPKADTGTHIFYSDSLRYTQWCDSLRDGLNDCAEMCLSQTVYGDTVYGDTVSVWYRAAVSQNQLRAIRLGYRLEVPMVERTITVTEEVERRVPARAIWLDGGIGYQQSYLGVPVGPVGSLGVSYRSASGVAVGIDAGAGMGGWNVSLRFGKRLIVGN